MSLTNLKQSIDTLSHAELRELRAYIEQREQATHPARGATPAERVARLRAAAAAIREGLTPAELEEMTAAMNAEYVEPADDDLWKD